MGVIKTIERNISDKIKHHKAGLYLALLFPIAFAFLLTFVISRFISYISPAWYIEWSPDVHVHHYAYGFFVLMAAGYLGLIFNGPRAKFWIALLFGLGLGLSFDEFIMWLRLRDDDPARWSYDGFTVVVLSLVLIATLPYIWHFIAKHRPFKIKKRLR